MLITPYFPIKNYNHLGRHVLTQLDLILVVSFGGNASGYPVGVIADIQESANAGNPASVFNSS
jgi:hypothetical protein